VIKINVEKHTWQVIIDIYDQLHVTECSIPSDNIFVVYKYHCRVYDANVRKKITSYACPGKEI